MAWEKLAAGELKNLVEIADLNFETTEEVPPLEGIIGQERAVNAVEFGLKVKRHGYNLFLSGNTGTGKTSYAESVLKEIASNEPVPDDWCYIYNFKKPGEPIAFSLPSGMGSVFVQDINELVEDIKEAIPKAFDGEDYEIKKGELVKSFQEMRSLLLDELNREAVEKGFVLKRTSNGFVTVPVKDGKQLGEEEYAALDQATREELEKGSTEVQLKIMEIMRRIQNEEKKLKEDFKKLNQKVGLAAIGHLFTELKEKYREFAPVLEYLQDFQDDVLTNLSDFRTDEEEQQPFPLGFIKKQGKEMTELRYQVNLLVDNSKTRGAPIVVEHNPSYYNLIGRVEYENRMGTVITDFTMIKSGAFHRANGGYLILQALDVLTGIQGWEVLKRVLKTKEIKIENIGDQFGLITISTLKPQPIPLQVKVILIGSPYLYQILYHYDEDFRKLFKIKADFEAEMERDMVNIKKMASFISSHCREEGLRHFDRSAVARIVNYSSRLADNQKKLSTCFNDIVEIIYEADAWAAIDGAGTVTAASVQKAIDEKIHRSNKYEAKIHELIRDNQIFLDLEGSQVGQINGLSVLTSGDYQFGRPSRITATTSLGRRGIVNIERESQLSGNIHQKGILILSGYLGERYARDIPLSLSASICFEQSYQGVDGDSASGAELFAILSSIAEVPLKQSLAVTGSVNQKGEIQPVGGINEKIEGFYYACKARELTGEQGVIIPHANRFNLMLTDEVVEAVKEGRFSIYTVSTVGDGIELLTGMAFGEPGDKGVFPQGTFNYLVREKLRRYHDASRKVREEESDDGKDEPEKKCSDCEGGDCTGPAL